MKGESLLWSLRKHFVLGSNQTETEGFMPLLQKATKEWTRHDYSGESCAQSLEGNQENFLHILLTSYTALNNYSFTSEELSLFIINRKMG